MRRRDFVAAGPTALLLGTARPLAQQTGRTYRIGVLGPGPVYNFNVGFPALLDELRKAGFVNGRNLVMEVRHISSDPRTTFEDAQGFAAAGVDLFITLSQEFTVRAALAASAAAPIVVQSTHFDIVEKGFAKSLARPGGRVTGLHLLMDHLVEKQLEVLTEIRPEQNAVGVLYDHFTDDQYAVVRRLSEQQGLRLISHRFGKPPYDWNTAFAALSAGSARKLLVLSSPFFTPHAKAINELSIRGGLPTMFIFPLYVDAGGLMSYGVDIVAIYRRVGQYAARVLSGTPPADLPIEQPREFRFKLNLRTARALNLEVPTSILVRADEVIE